MEAKVNRIKRLVAEVIRVPPEKLSLTSRFREEHAVDSLRSIEIMATLEREFDVEISSEALARMVDLAGVLSVMDELATAK